MILGGRVFDLKFDQVKLSDIFPSLLVMLSDIFPSPLVKSSDALQNPIFN